MADITRLLSIFVPPFLVTPIPKGSPSAHGCWGHEHVNWESEIQGNFMDHCGQGFIFLDSVKKRKEEAQRRMK